ncbi:ATP synthase [Ralstonia sp. A12]|uniref:ATP synthase subunit I n=1 Tax=Ralstonia sp. A12 TaxID=1217052 RepID=UPI000574636C|nr:ATP synthase subunit I [Ralstonia sp. A12]KHK55401.1 ATP synthase [Ralstonia sp. A12]
MMKDHSSMQPAERQRPDSYASLEAARPQSAQAPGRDDWDDDAEKAEPPVHVLSHDEAVAMFGEQALRASRITPFSIVLGQVAITLLCALGWYVGSWFAGTGAASAGQAALSALLGGGVCVVPSAWFAMRLSTAKGFESIARLVVGEAIKVLGTVALLVVVVVVFKGLHWPPLLITLILALKMYWVGLALR